MEYVISETLWISMLQSAATFNMPLQTHTQLQQLFRQVAEQAKADKEVKKED